MRKTTPQEVQAALLTGYEIHQADVGMAVLVPGVEKTDAAGKRYTIGQGAYLLSEALCRELAGSLVEMADRLRSSSGSA